MIRVRRYPTLTRRGKPQPSEPPSQELFGRLCRHGIRLRDDGNTLMAQVPADLLARPVWRDIDRRLRLGATFLADLAAVVEGIREALGARRVAAVLAMYDSATLRAALDNFGGRMRAEELTRGPLTGARLDLACATLVMAAAVEGAARLPGRPGDGSNPDQEPARPSEERPLWPR
jgi:hypothetical protein